MAFKRSMKPSHAGRKWLSHFFDQVASLLFEPFQLMLLFFSSTSLTSGYAASILVTTDGTRHKIFIHIYTLEGANDSHLWFSSLNSITNNFFSKPFPPECFCKLVNKIINCYCNKSVSCRTSGLEITAIFSSLPVHQWFPKWLIGHF